MGDRARARVAVLDDHRLFVEALELALELSGVEVVRLGVEAVVGGVARGATLRATRPDVVILDLDLGQAGNGARLIGPLVGAGVAVLVVTATQDRVRWGHCLRLGAAGVLVKTTPLARILEAVETVRQGRPVMSPSDRDELVRTWHADRDRRRAQHARFDRLTRREQEVLLGLAHGRRVGEIAAEAVVAESTVRSQVKSILAKLGVSSQIAAVGLVHESGWPDRSES